MHMQVFINVSVRVK